MLQPILAILPWLEFYLLSRRPSARGRGKERR
jgi:hypothetical protein